MAFIDNHTHLDDLGLEPGPRPVEELVLQAALAGVDTLIHSAVDVASSRWALEQADRFPGVWVSIGYHPHEAGNTDDDGLDRLAALTAHPKVLALGETGLDYYRNSVPRLTQQRVFVRHLEMAAAAGLPVVIHSRDAADDTLRLLDSHGAGLTVVLHCFSLPERLAELIARGYFLSFAGNVTFKNAPALQAALRSVPMERLLLETDAPFLAPVPFRGRPNSSALVVHTYEFAARQRGTTVQELAACVRENAARAYPRLRLGPARPVCLGPRVTTYRRPAVTAADPDAPLRQTSLARLAEFGVVPKRDLGQNFLIDDNILGVILAQLECGSGDVVLEIGAGLGVLTGALAGVARHVHAFEVDRSLEAPLRATLRAAIKDGSMVSLHFQDVLKAALEDLDPLPSLCASNLPYSVAGPFIVESLQRLPSVRRYCVMVQREVAERMAAGPGSKTYGTLSVWVQLYSKVVRARPLSRSIFYPQPHVDSSLLVLDRLPEEKLPTCDPVRLKAVVQAAFGQRRKTLVNALSAGLGVTRPVAQAVVETLGLAADVRAERLEPAQFVALAEAFEALL